MSGYFYLSQELKTGSFIQEGTAIGTIYPEIAAQKRAHSAFVARLVEIDLSELESLDDNQQDYLLELIDFLLSWLTNHILACDKKIGVYMRENNINE